jgi:hypothetical protein
MTHIELPFKPSEDLAEKLERVFGAARWVHNRAMIRQWTDIHAGRVPPSLPTLVQDCIDEPAKKPETELLNLVPRGVLLDELEDLMDGWDDLKDIRSQRALPLKKKKEEQEIIYPRGYFSLTVTPDGLGIELDQTGRLALVGTSITASTKAEAVKIERDIHDLYKATVYFA